MKKRKIFGKIMLIAIVVYIILMIGYTILRKKYLISYNQDYINQYMTNELANCEIKEINQYVYIPPVMFDGGHFETVEEDDISEQYKMEVDVYDNEFNIEYTITFSHFANEKMEIEGNDREYYIENYKKYQKNFEYIKGIVESYACNVTNLGTYSETNIGRYILLMYVPDSQVLQYVISELSDKVYGNNYLYDKTVNTQGIEIENPRYIICDNIDTYNQMANNIEKISDMMYGKNYECERDVNPDYITEFINDGHVWLEGIANTLLDETLSTDYDVEITSDNYGVSKFNESGEWILIYERDENPAAYWRNLYKKNS